MKAVILAAGMGTRLRPLTNKVPKVMLLIDEHPLLYHQLRWLKENGISDVAINLHHLSQKVTEYVKKNNWGLNIEFSHESKLLGTAGAVKKLQKFLENEPFVIFYGDNITDLKLNSLIEYHKEKGGIATMCLHPVEQKSINESSYVKLNEDQMVTYFIEKPNPDQVPISEKNYSNAGIYVLDPKIFDFIPENRFCDFGIDTFPKLLTCNKGIYGYHLDNCYWREIGTVDKYRLVQKEINSMFLP